ncbi:hypothetical protein K1719_012918 [Acacia pycnantha]|nr:hypothetical protein K1719_012918 [Acacia pycnantha]
MEEGESCSAIRELTTLVVDDQEVLRRIHGRLLKDVGVSHVEAAGNGKEAIDIHRGVRSHIAVNSSRTLILSSCWNSSDCSYC